MAPHTLDAIPPEDEQLFKLMAYIDGELAQDEEPELFTALAQNEFLRHELRTLIGVSSPFKSLEVSPPKTSKRLVLAAAGLPVGAGTMTAGMLNGGSLSTVGAALSGAVAAAMLTAGSMFFLWSPSNENAQESQLTLAPQSSQSFNPDLNNTENELEARPGPIVADAAGGTTGEHEPARGQAPSANTGTLQANSPAAQELTATGSGMASAESTVPESIAPKSTVTESARTASADAESLNQRTSNNQLRSPANKTNSSTAGPQAVNNSSATNSQADLSLNQMARKTAANEAKADANYKTQTDNINIAELLTQDMQAATEHNNQESPTAFAAAPTLQPSAIVGLNADVAAENANSSEYLPGDMFLVLRGFQTRSFPDLNIDPLVAPPVNNVAAGLFYRLDKNQSVGLQMGQEHLLQRFEETVGSTTIRYDQNFLALWYGVSYEYSFSSWSWMFNSRPYVTGVAAWNRTGPMVRSSAGLRVPLTRTLSMRLSTEFSTALYQFDGSWFSSEKVGISYGLELGL